MSDLPSEGGSVPFGGVLGCDGIECRIVMVSLSTRTSLTMRRDDLLPIGDLQRLRRVVQPLKEGGQGFGEAQVRHPIGGLTEDGLHFRPHGLFAGAQFQHLAPQFVEG